MHQSPVPDQDVTSARCVSHDIAAAFRNLGFEKGSQYSLRVFGPNVVSLVRFEGGQDFLSGDLRPSMRTWDVLEWSRIRADVIERDPGSRIEVADMFGIEIGVLVPIAFSASPTCEIEMDACWFADQGLEQFSQRSIGEEVQNFFVAHVGDRVVPATWPVPVMFQPVLLVPAHLLLCHERLHQDDSVRIPIGR